MKNILILFAFSALLFSCSSEPEYKDKINERAYQSIEIGSTYEQVLFKVGGMDGKELTPGLFKWENGEIGNSNYSIAVSIKDGRVVSKMATTSDENGKVIKKERFPN